MEGIESPDQQKSAKELSAGNLRSGDKRKHHMGYYLLTYFCIAVFMAAVSRLIYRHLTLPLHVRWEIYPVQHETAEKNIYGGSYMEKVDWWKSPYEISRLNVFKYMVPEILLLRGLWKENRSLWLVSFPFHLGLYLMMAMVVLLLFNALFTLWGGAAFAAGGVVKILMDSFIFFIGWTGLIAGMIGGLGIFYKRSTDRELKTYSTFADYFKIIFIFLFYFFAFLTVLSGDPFLDGAKAYVLGLLTAGAFVSDYAPGQTMSGALTIVLASLLIAYIPLTHMSHMFMKYFLYHNVKWDDVPNRPGSLIESAVVMNLKFKPTWNAKHIGADGKKSWQDIASSAPKETK
jgi:nitrate reductase gamma subunit